MRLTTAEANARTITVDRLKACGVIAVVRIPSSHNMLRVAESLMKGGVSALEITLTTAGAFEAIQELRREFAEHALVGAGSVLSLDSAQSALDAGASYLVSPVNVDGLVDLAHGNGAATMIGAFTPSEMLDVHQQKSDLVKLFPADTLGPAFLKGVMAPMPMLRVVPTGGISADNAGAWIRVGACAVGAGSSLVDPKLVADQNWTALTERALAFSAAVRNATEVSV